MLHEIGTALLAAVQEIGYLGLFFATFLENIVPPIPSELIMPFGGYLASTGRLNLVGAMLVATLGSLCGTIPYYFLGRVLHKQKVLRRAEKYGKFFLIGRKTAEEAFQLFEKNGEKIVFFSRFVPGARGLVSLPAGSANMNFLQFFIYTFAGTFIRAAALTSIGFYLGKNREQIGGFLEQYATIVLSAIALFRIGFFIKKWVSRFLRRQKILKENSPKN